MLLGVPNSGANLEVIANLTSSALWSLPNPVTRLIGAGLDRRSEGIKDLRWGAVLDEDWIERDPACHRAARTPSGTYIPVTRRYLAVAGYSRTNDVRASHPVNRLLGDALVTAPSAEGRLGEGEPAFFPNATVRALPEDQPHRARPSLRGL